MDCLTYSNRLKQIRQKYNSTIKSNLISESQDQSIYRPTVLRGQNQYNTHSQTRSRQFSQVQSQSIRNKDDISTHRRDDKSMYNPQSQTYRKCHAYDDDPTLKQKDLISTNYDRQIFASSKKREQRMQQIEDIRKSFAESRKKTIQDFTKQRLQKSNKRLDIRALQEGYGGLRERLNTITDPLQNRFSQKRQLTLKDYKRQSQQPLRLNFDYSSTQLNRLQNRQNDYRYQSFRNDLATVKSKIIQSPLKYRQTKHEFKNVSQNCTPVLPRETKQTFTKFDRQNINVATSIIRQFQGPSIKYQSGSSSPIKGLKGHESFDKGIRQRNWNPSNIDRIQERIRSVLGKR